MIPPLYPDRAGQPDPHQDQSGQPIPAGITELLHLTRILIGYGHHLAALMPLGAVWSAFAIVARFLGGNTLAETLFCIQRGLMRAIALERVLLRRAQRGRDVSVLAPRIRLSRPRMPDPWQASDDPADSPYGLDLPAGTLPAIPPGCSDDPHASDPDALPTLEDLEAEIRRRPIGRTLAAICLDLGVSPSLCTGWFWNRLFQAMITYQGNLAGLLTELNRRQLSFDQTHKPPPQRPLPLTQEAVRYLLGFFIGEPPDLPPWPATWPSPAASAATGPP